jgi:hypothetical protein
MTTVVGKAAVSAAQFVGDTAYGIAHKAMQVPYMFYDLGQCGYFGIHGAITGDFSEEPNWMSDLAKNAPDPNDKEATGRYFVQLELENLKDGAIQVATLGVGKALGPVICKITKTGCFAAGTPVPVEHGCKAVEDVRKGDRVWMRPENDPTAPPILGEVAATFKTRAPICDLHVGGKIVRTTHGHPFWVRGKGWTTAADLKRGQELRTEDGWVSCGQVVDTGGSADVYNFEVAEGHTYFVGDPVTWGFALWNHNVGDCGIVANAAAGARREAAAAKQLAEANSGASIQAQRLLRDANGRKLIDPITGSGRRIDLAVVKNAQVQQLAEVTSETADKVQQIAKEARIRQLGDVFIRNRETRALLNVTNIPTGEIRLP